MLPAMPPPNPPPLIITIANAAVRPIDSHGTVPTPVRRGGSAMSRLGGLGHHGARGGTVEADDAFAERLDLDEGPTAGEAEVAS